MARPAVDDDRVWICTPCQRGHHDECTDVKKCECRSDHRNVESRKRASRTY